MRRNPSGVNELRQSLLSGMLVSVVTFAGAAAQTPIDYRALFEKGTPYDRFLNEAKSHRKELWHSNHARAAAADDVLRRARAIGSKLRILVVAIDGCSDSASIIPFIAKLAHDANIELRIVAPDAGGRAVMEAHRTPDGRAATPTIVLLDSAHQNVGVFTERPSNLHAWYEEREATGIETSKLTAQKLEWYARDAGRSTLSELVALMERAVTK
jgi:hypothetical protein